MEPSALTDLARLALPVIAGLVGRLGRQSAHINFAELSGTLSEFSETLSRSTLSPQQRQRLEENTTTILDHVEKACAASHYQQTGRYPVLSAIAKEQDSWRQIFRFSKLGPEQWKIIQKNLQEYILRNPDFAGLVKLLKQCSMLEDHEYADLVPDIDFEEMGTKRSIWANDALYTVLWSQLNSCDCEPAIHLTRLRLNPRDEVKDSTEVHFEVQFSINSQERRSRWQEAKILAPSEDPRVKKVKFKATKKQPSIPSPHDGRTAIDDVQLCSVLRTTADSLLSLRMDFPQLRRLHSGGQPVQETQLGDTLCLSHFLDGSTTKKEQCILAYTLSKSMWQFYESKWTGVPWRPENLHLLNDGYDGTSNSKGSSRLYLAMDFGNPDMETGIPEFYDADHTMHRYPRVLALGLLLIEIARGQPLEEQQSLDISSINRRYTLARKYFNRDVLPNEKIYPAYQEAVKMCLAFDLFDEAGFNSTDQRPEQALKHRRDILYKKVVAPLKGLLVGTGWWPDVDKIRRGPTVAPQRTAELRATTLTTPYLTTTRRPSIQPDESEETNMTMLSAPMSLLGNEPKWIPEYWVTKMSVMSGLVSKDRPVKIAVLDTGCNLDARVFITRDQVARVKNNWEDFAGQSPEPEDEHNHGTRIVSLLLRIAPKAEIHVLRIAKNLKDLANASRNIAKAIETVALKVDIISLSFGFPKQDHTIRKAIDKAHLMRDHSIIFLAAAANDGSNSTEMFPASMESVISIRGTDATGAFVSGYDPNTPSFKQGRPAYGTLGQNVFCGWPETPEDLPSFMMSGCSIATPIAAAIAALIIGYVDSSDRFDENQKRKIRSRRAIEAVFHSISVKKGNDRFYLAPWDLLNSEGKVQESAIEHAIDRIPD